MKDLDIGMIGLGVMGQNLALNIVDHGFSVGGWDAWPDPVARFAAMAAGNPAQAFTELPALVAALRRPRRIIMLVKAGEVVDKTIATLARCSPPATSLSTAATRTSATPSAGHRAGRRRALFFGMGVSGGEEGARLGPSLMPGGDRDAYDDMAPILTKIAAQVDDGPCVTYCGPGGAGHFVKMVHNGIEYGDMQLIAEAYDLLTPSAGSRNAELADVFDEWNRGELQSFLIEITAKIFRTRIRRRGGDLDRRDRRRGRR